MNALATILPTRDMIITAIVNVFDNKNKLRQCRIVLDTGSMSNFITEGLARKLSLKLTKFDVQIAAIGSIQSEANYLTTATIQSRTGGYTRTLDFFNDTYDRSHVPYRANQSYQFTYIQNYTISGSII